MSTDASLQGPSEVIQLTPVPDAIEAMKARLGPISAAQCAYLNPGMLHGMLEGAFPDADILTAANALCLPEHGALLERRATLTDRYGNDYDIDASELREAEESGEIVHPYSGDLMPIYGHLSIYFAKP